MDERGPQALEVITRALDILRAVHPPDHPDVGRAHDAMAGAYLLVGNGARALEHADRAIAIYTASYGAEHPAVRVVVDHRARAKALVEATVP
jgi:hypothetical protein